MTHKFRFAVLNTGNSLDEWQAFARKAEDLGFSTLVVQDHFAPQLAPLPALVAAGAVTSRIRLGTIVLDNDFRHPAALAKEAATVDVLTGGRLELGVGAGWMMADYEKTGLVFGPPAERLERLRETVKIVKAFFTEDSVTFEGKHYKIAGLDSHPKPAQKPHPPIMIGGRQKRMLSFAAREADIVSISMLDRRVPGEPPPPSFSEKVGWVRAAAGPFFESIEIHANGSNITVTDDARGALAALSDRLKITPEEAVESPANLVGSVDAIAEKMHEWREKCGLSYLAVNVRVMDAVAPLVAKLTGA